MVFFTKSPGVLLIVCFLAASSATPASGREAANDGLLVLFKKHDPAAQDELHRRLRATVSYRSTIQHIDVVRLDDAKANADPRLLAKACHAYLAQDSVEKCSLNKPLKEERAAGHEVRAVVARPCPPGSTVPVSAAALVQPIAPVDTAACQPYPGMGDDGQPPFSPEDPKVKRDPILALGKLTPMWAQEAVGAPETRELLAELDKAGPPPRKINVGILDGAWDLTNFPANHVAPSLQPCLDGKNRAACGTDGNLTGEADRAAFASGSKPGARNLVGNSHGTSVANVMLGGPPSSMSSRGQVSLLGSAVDEGGFVPAMDRFLGAPPDRLPEVVNMSMSVPDVATTGFRNLTRRTTVVVAASNEFPDPIDHAKRSSDAIIVGSIQPNGLSSIYSKEDSEVTISAPSNYELSTRGPGGRYTSFAGTSGASPVVSGALINLKSLLPGITNAEIKKLLQSTAIPTAGTADGRNLNGAGSLNEFKMIKIAAALREQWPQNRGRIAGETFGFAQDVATDLAQADAAVAEGGQSCDARKKALKALRHAFLLDPSSETVRRRLARLYRDDGFEEQAQFYDPPAQTQSTPRGRQLGLDRKFLAAVGRGDEDAARRFLEQGANVNAYGGGPEHPRMAINAVARSALPDATKRELVRFLLARGAKLPPNEDIMDNYEERRGGKTLHLTRKLSPLDWATRNGHSEAATQLAAGGARLTQSPAEANAALILAAGEGQPVRADILFREGADVNFRDPSGTTPLLAAAISGNVDMVRRLLAAHANPRPTPGTDDAGHTVMNDPAQVARDAGHPEVAQIIEAARH